MIQDRSIGVIRITKDYEKFTFGEYNRPISRSIVARLKTAIKKSDQTKAFPILCDDRFKILDGQHRFTACKEMGLPITYLQVDSFSLSDLALTNSVNHKWKPEDFVRVYANLGKQSYVRLQQDMEQYRLPVSSISHIIGLGSNHAILKAGNLCYTETEQTIVRNFIKSLMFFKDCRISFWKEYRFVRAFSVLYSQEQYRPDIMKRQIQHYHDRLTRSVNWKGYYLKLEDIYNYHRRNLSTSPHITLSRTTLDNMETS